MEYPKCGSGQMRFFPKVVKCNDPDCELPIFRMIAGKQLTDAQITDLAAHRKTGVLKGFQSKAGTDVGSDLILLQKNVGKTELTPFEQDFIKTRLRPSGVTVSHLPHVRYGADRA